MKKVFKIIMLVIVALVLVLTAMACGQINSKQQQTDTSNTSKDTDTETKIETLQTVSDIEINGYSITWSSVPLATYYGVIIDGEEHLIDGTSFDLRTINLPKGAYSVQIKAYTDQKGYLNSVSQTKAFTYVGAEETKYSVRIVSQEGGTTNITSKEYKANNIVDLIAYPKEGYHFDGWYSDNYYKLSSEKTFSFPINNNTIIFAYFSPNTEMLSKESSDDSELMRCAEDFAVVVLCREGENYIKEHFFVYDDYFLDDNGNVVNGCEEYAERALGKIESRGNDLYLISPKEEYAKSGAYVAKATGNVSILKEYSRFMNSTGAQNAEIAAAESDMDLSYLTDDQGIDALAFSIDNTPHENIRLQDNVYIYSYSNNANATSTNVDGWILERIGTGIYDPDTNTYGGFTTRSINVRNGYTLKVGDVVGFGGNMTKDISVSQIDETSIFGKIHDIVYCGDTEYAPIIYIELESVEQDSDVFDVLDVYAEGAVYIEEYIDANAAAIQEGAVKMFYNSEDFQKFLASVEVATEVYAEENDCEFSTPMTAAAFMDDIDIKPSIERSGNRFTLTIKGNIEIEFGKKDVSFGKTRGTFSISFEFKETLEFEYSFSWIKKDINLWFVQFKITNGVDLKLITTSETEFTFDVAIKYSAGTQTEYLLNENTKWIHVPECFHVKAMLESNKKNSTESLEAIEKKGYTQCKDCIGKSAKWVLNTSTKCIHRRGCWHTNQMLPSNKKPSDLSLDYLTDQGYWPCGTCLADAKDEWIDLEGTESYRQKLSQTLNYEDWGDKLKEIKNNIQNSEGVYDSTKDFKICEVPVTYVVTFWFKAYLTLSFNIEASVHYEQRTTTQVTIGVRAAIGEGFHTSYEKKESGTTQEMTIVGKIGVKAGIKLEVAVSDPLNIVSFGVYGTIGAYADLSGIVHLSNKGENYAAAYLEIGFYYDFGITYKVLVLQGSVSIAKACGLPGKVPLLQMGYNKVIYAYTTDITETLVQASENKKEFTLRELNLMGVKTLSLPSIKTGTETLDPTSSLYNVNMRLASGEYLYIDGVNIKIKDNAPFGTTFEDELTISITSKDKSWKKFTGTNSILYLPTITVKLICSNKCEEHSLILLETIEPQCTETGVEECLQCTRCFKLFDVEMTKELSERKVIPSLGHDDVSIPAVAPECMKTGLTEGTICQRCHYISVPQQMVDALGHEAGEEWYVEKDATCEEQGRAYQGCIRCGLAMNYTTILPHGHRVGDQELSCSDPIACLDCGKVLAEKIGHDYHSTSRKEPTCETNGWEVFTCRRCSESKTEIIYAIGHTKRQDATNVWVSLESTCIEAGEWSWRCDHENCDEPGGKVLTEEFNPDGHLYDENYTVDVEPTCTFVGEKSIHCLKCGVKKADSIISIPALGHDSEPANCTEAEVCRRCYTELNPALGHNYVLVESGNENALYRCTRCSDEVTHTHDFTVKVVQPTCTSQGYTEHTCTSDFCRHYSYRSDFTQREHIWVESTHQDATCTVNGSVDYTCQYNDCDETKREVLTAQHIYDEEYTVDKAATCTEKGSKSKHCRWYDTCGAKSDVAEIPMTGHTLDREHATCEEDSTCTVCGQILEKATGHNYQEVDGTREYINYTALFRCTKCGDEKSEAFAHNFDAGKVIAPTCVAQGYTIYRCTDPGCTFEKKENYTAVIDHTYPQTGVRTNPTCIEEGYDTYTCTVCGHMDVRNYNGNAALGHRWSTDAAVAPTCTVPGKTEGSHCLRCKIVDIEQETIPALGHNYKTTVVAPTCTAQGYTHYSCRRNCNEEGDEYDNTFVAAHGLTEVAAVAATCTIAGKNKYYRCNNAQCGKLYADSNGTREIIESDTIVAALGHDFNYNGATVDEKPSSCAEKGYKKYKCSRCNETDTVLIGTLPHTYVTDPAVAATCTTSGKTEGSHCSVCGEITKPQDPLDPIGHTESGWIVTQEPTCAVDGSKHKICTVCNVELENAVIAKHGLSHTEARPQGCFVDGNKEYWYCETCNKYFKDKNATQETTLAERTLAPYGEHNYVIKERYTGGSVCTENYTIFECSRCQQGTDPKYDDHGEIENGRCKKCGYLLVYDYIITFDKKSGTGGTASVTATYNSAMPSITLPTRTGYTFGGYYYTEINGNETQYYTANGTSSRNWDKTEDITLYAKWEAKTYKITGTSTNGVVYWSTSSILTSGGSTSLNAKYGSTVYYRIAPSIGYSAPSTSYGSFIVSGNNFTFNHSSLTATKTLTACSAIVCSSEIVTTTFKAYVYCESTQMGSGFAEFTVQGIKVMYNNEYYVYGNAWYYGNLNGNRFNDVAGFHLKNSTQKILLGGVFHWAGSEDDNNESGVAGWNKNDGYNSDHIYYFAEDPGKDFAGNENVSISITDICVRMSSQNGSSGPVPEIAMTTLTTSLYCEETNVGQITFDVIGIKAKYNGYYYIMGNAYYYGKPGGNYFPDVADMYLKNCDKNILFGGSFLWRGDYSNNNQSGACIFNKNEGYNTKNIRYMMEDPGKDFAADRNCTISISGICVQIGSTDENAYKAPTISTSSFTTKYYCESSYLRGSGSFSVIGIEVSYNNVTYLYGNAFFSGTPGGDRFNDVARFSLSNLSKSVLLGGTVQWYGSNNDNNESAIMGFDKKNSLSTNATYLQEDPGKDFPANEGTEISITGICVKK